MRQALNNGEAYLFPPAILGLGKKGDYFVRPESFVNGCSRRVYNEGNVSTGSGPGTHFRLEWTLPDYRQIRALVAQIVPRGHQFRDSLAPLQRRDEKDGRASVIVYIPAITH
ncbi:hypothetical protein MTE01_20430 [Microbacterium testaceum]|uniref:Uncharacterized protein n=1 Tax=Microbacterium testaceum TaxID=2033 RepID=A0A4Y3QNL8_MICTE|nr:hypothetical protein MTE01_20430 [Microbacterium testaceum]